MRVIGRRSALAAALPAVALPLAAWMLPAQGTAPTAAPAGVVRPRTLYEDIQMFSGVLNQIRQNHPDSVDTHQLIMAAIMGMVRAADPHSYVVEAVRVSPEREKALRDGKLVPVPIDWMFFGASPVVA